MNTNSSILLKIAKPSLEHPLTRIKDKVELSLKLFWQDMDKVFSEIMEENKEIRSRRNFMLNNNIHDQNEKIALGQLIEEALNIKKERLCGLVVERLRPAVEDLKIQKNITDTMFANLVFLVSKDTEPMLDKVVNGLSAEWNDNVTFKYVGPTAPYNFI